MAGLTHQQIRNAKKKVSEPVSVFGRGDGSLLFWPRKSGNIECYYRYREKGNDQLIKLGQYQVFRDGDGISLLKARQKANDFARLRREIGGDLKQYLEVKEIERQAQEREAKQQARNETGLGTFSELCDNYVEQQRRDDKKDWRRVRSTINKHVFGEFPHLKSVKARELTSDDIIDVISLMIEKGLTTVCNRLRSHLHAVFNYGIKSDNNPRERVAHGKKFGIKFNPVSSIPRQADFERVRERVLSHQEIYQLWHEFPKRMTTISPMYGLLLRFMFACGGNRPVQLSRCRWSDFDLENKTFTFIDYKGRRAEGVKRVMPLSDRALNIIREVRQISGGFDLVFTIRGGSPISESNLAHKLDDFYKLLMAEAAKEGRSLAEKYTAKDIRRTVTGLLIKARVSQEQRYLIQSRTDGSIEGKHYDHSDRLEEKYESLLCYDNLLDKILKGENAKLIDLNGYRRRAG